MSSFLFDHSDAAVERRSGLMLGAWVIWLSAEFIVLGPDSYVVVHDFGDSLVPQAIGEGGAGFQALFGGWDAMQVGGVDKATYLAGQFKLLKLTFGVIPAWLAFGLFGILQRTVAGYFTYRVVRDVFGGRWGPALSAGMLAAVGLQPSSHMLLFGVTYNLGLGVSLIPLMIWLHWRIATSRPGLFVAAMFVIGALISLTTVQVFAWPVLVAIGIWILASTPIGKWLGVFPALFAFGIGYGLFELPIALAMLADLPESHRSFTPTRTVDHAITSLIGRLKTLAITIAVPLAAISGSFLVGGRHAISGRFLVVIGGCTVLMTMDTSLTMILEPVPGPLLSFNFIRVSNVLSIFIILAAGMGLGTARASEGAPRRFVRVPVSALTILTVAVALWSVGQSVWIKFQGLRYYGHGSNYTVLYENPALKRIAGLKNDATPFRVATLSIKGVTHLQRSGHPWAYGLETADGYISIYPRRYQELWVQAVAPAAETSPYYYNYMRNTGTRLFLTAEAPDCRLINLSNFANLNVLSLLNIRFIISPCPLQDPELKLFAETREGPGQEWHRFSKIDKFLSIFRGDFPSKELFIYENPAVLPRYFLVSAVRIFTTRAKSLSAIGEASRQTLRTTAVVAADDIKGLELPGGETGAAASDGSVSVLSINPDEIRLKVDANRDSVLVIANSYTPRWSAMVNGERRKVFPVDHAFQGVIVGKGHSVVVLKYTSAVWQLLGRQ